MLFGHKMWKIVNIEKLMLFLNWSYQNYLKTILLLKVSSILQFLTIFKFTKNTKKDKVKIRTLFGHSMQKIVNIEKLMLFLNSAYQNYVKTINVVKVWQILEFFTIFRFRKNKKIDRVTIRTLFGHNRWKLENLENLMLFSNSAYQNYLKTMNLIKLS